MSDPTPKQYTNCGTAPLVLGQNTAHERTVAPGETFTAALPPDMEAFLMTIEAIREVTVADASAVTVPDSLDGPFVPPDDGDEE